MDRRLMLEIWSDRRGAIAPIAAIVLTVVLGFAALSLDMGHNYFVQNRLQAAADASSLAGVSQLPDEAAMVTKAQEYAEKNMPSADYGAVLANADVLAGNWDPVTRTFTLALEPLNAVQTTTRQEAASGNAAPVFLGQIFGHTGYDLHASAIATVGIGPDVFPTGCITALNTTDPEAFYIFGTAEVSAVGCDIQINSGDPCALHAHGTPTVTVVEADGSGGIYVAGGVCTEGPVSLSPAPETGQDPIEDPYKNNDPYPDDFTDADCDFTNATFNDSATIQPGVYCGGITWTGSGTATFAPTGPNSAHGEYIIRNGPLDIGGNVAIDAVGVGFYLTGPGSVINFKGTSDIAMSAPTSGPLAGFVFFEDDKDPNETHTLRGTNGGGYEGVLYFDGDVELKGTADSGLASGGDCTVLIADTVYFNGTTGLAANDTCSGDVTLPPGVGNLIVRLVE